MVESGDSNVGITLKDSGGEASVRAIGDALTLNTTSSETERLHIMSTGRVGINSGGAPTDIPATSHDTVVVGNSSMTSGGICLEGNAAASGNLGYQFFKGGSERVRVDSSGNVGIGTASPSTKFEVQTASNERIQFLSNGSNEQPRIDLTARS